jgi:succinate dehydrogenase flavin-adding protein (antitoxin of CptAB toxin-antitoxin module)
MAQQNQTLLQREDYSERKFFARGLASFSSDKLAEFIDFLEEIDPKLFGVRQGGVSFHIDFHSLSDELQQHAPKSQIPAF